MMAAFEIPHVDLEVGWLTDGYMGLIALPSVTPPEKTEPPLDPARRSCGDYGCGKERLLSARSSR